jgi:Na+-transporting NADH:ubiquinone oxidoreductase subunit NqrE
MNIYIYIYIYLFFSISTKRYHSSVIYRVYARFSAFPPRDIIVSHLQGLCTFFSISTKKYHSSVVYRVYARFSAFPPIDLSSVVYRVYARFSAFPPRNIIPQWSMHVSLHFHQEISFVSDLHGLCTFFSISTKRYHSSVIYRVYARFSAFSPRYIIRQWCKGSMHVFKHFHQEISFVSGLCTFFSISTKRYHSSVIYRVYFLSWVRDH